MSDFSSALLAIQTPAAPTTEAPVTSTVENKVSDPAQVPQETELDRMKKQYQEREAQLTAKFDNLTRRERALISKEQEVKSKIQGFGSVEELRSLAEKDPLKALEKLNLSYDKLTDIYAGMTPSDENAKVTKNLQDDLNSLKQEILQERSEGQMKEIMRVRDQKLAGFKNLANAESSQYNLVAAFSSYDDVLEYMSQHYQATGEVLADDEALRHVEDRLLEGMSALKNNPKLRSIFGATEQAQVQQGQQQVSPFSLSDQRLRNETPKTEQTQGLSDAKLFELALQKLPSL